MLEAAQAASAGLLIDLLHCKQIEKVVIPTKKTEKPFPDYGFVHFTDRSSAVKLVEECEATENPRRLEFPVGSGNMLQVLIIFSGSSYLWCCIAVYYAVCQQTYHHLFDEIIS